MVLMYQVRLIQQYIDHHQETPLQHYINTTNGDNSNTMHVNGVHIVINHVVLLCRVVIHLQQHQAGCQIRHICQDRRNVTCEPNVMVYHAIPRVMNHSYTQDQVRCVHQLQHQTVLCHQLRVLPDQNVRRNYTIIDK